MGLTKEQRKAKADAERIAAWQAEEDRVRKSGELFEDLPEGPAKSALMMGITDRIITLYNEARFEEGDAILEFLPNAYARALLDWYFEDDGPDTFTVPPDFAPQPDTLLEVFEVAQDLVELWDSPTIKGLARADRNQAIDETKSRLREVVYVAQDVRRPSRHERHGPSGTSGQSERAQIEAPRDAEAPQAVVESETPADQGVSRTEGRRGA